MKHDIIRFVVIILAAGAMAFGASPSGQVVLGNMLAQVGVTVGVAPNPYNSLDAQLNAKQSEIDAEAADLAAREAQLASTTATASAAGPVAGGWYFWGAVLLLTLLVGTNFVLDWRRGRKEAQMLRKAETQAAQPQPPAPETPSEGGTIK